MEQTVYQVDAFWDGDAAVWIATSEDVPGLATEADTIEALRKQYTLFQRREPGF